MNPASRHVRVVRAGMLDQVQDLGRPGHAAMGQPAGGAADALALRQANRLTGNPEDLAGIEIVLRGPTLVFSRPTRIALTGARFEARQSGGGRVPWRQPVVMASGSWLEIGPACDGARCWLAIEGGIAVPRVLGSRSTFLPGGFGGIGGRALRDGDTLPLGPPAPGSPDETRQASPVASAHKPAAWDVTELRLIPGPQIAGFDDASVLNLPSAIWRVTPEADRAGLRLDGPGLCWRGDEILSQGVLPGAVQVTPAGQLIILGWDGPVTGGYPVIGGVVAADLGRLARLRTGDGIRFIPVSPEAAYDAWRQRLLELGLDDV